MYRVVENGEGGDGVGDGDVEGRSWENGGVVDGENGGVVDGEGGGVVDVSNAASLTTPDRSMFYKTWIGTNNVLKYRTNMDKFDR